MCLHELWTYSECGCQVDHLVPCLNALKSDESPHEPSPQRRYRRKTSLRGIRSPSPLRIVKRPATNTSPVHLPPSPSPTNSEFSENIEAYYRQPEKPQPQTRECSVNHTIDKKFLEPICDDCLLQELGVNLRTDFVAPHDRSSSTNEMVWASDVKIEVSDNPPSSPRTEILESNVEVLIEEAEQETLPALKYQEGPPGHTRQQSTLSATDADDEGSFRGRPRSRTKQLRRKGIDITREQLRISSRLPTLDKQTLSAFRDDIQRKTQDALRLERGGKEHSPCKTFLSRFKEVESGGKTWMRGVVGDLKRSLSRNSKRERGAKQRETVLGPPRTLTHSQSLNGAYTLRAVIEQTSAIDLHREHAFISTGITDIEESCPSPDIPFYRATTAPDSKRPAPDIIHSYQKDPETNTDTSWQAHLSYDLAKHPHSRRHIHSSKSTTRLASNFTSASSNGPNWLIKSQSLHSLPLRSYSEHESRRHLLSMTSTVPSIPATASSTWSEPPSGQRLASIVSESEFDTLTEHPWNTRLEAISQEVGDEDGDRKEDEVEIEDEQEAGDDCEVEDESLDGEEVDNTTITSSATSHQHATSIDTTRSIHTLDAISPPRPVRKQNQVQHARTHCHDQNHTDTPRPNFGLAMHPLATPVPIALPIRPALTPRESSFKALALSSSINLKDSRQDMKETCVWQRLTCLGQCGAIIGEDVVSCICDHTQENTRGCRSTQPLVRYADAEGSKGRETLCDECIRKKAVADYVMGR